MFELVSAAVAIAVVYLLFAHSRLQRRLGDLERRIRELRVKGKAEAVAESPADKVADKAAGADQAGPWALAKGKEIAATLAVERPGATPKAFVFNTENWRAARDWLAENWFLAVAAVSLALAGVFLVQFGVENGLISPFWRVMAAAGLGVALIWAGEFVRRRWGDGHENHTAYLPSTFAGAGLVALFAAVLSARQLYGLIGAEAALVWLVMVSGVAVVLGWFYGPYLAVVGILGSIAAPFLVGGDAEAPQLFYYYFAFVAIAALLVDAIKRWAWVSVLGLISAFSAAWFIWFQGAAGEHFLAFGLIVAAAAVSLPNLNPWPAHTGSSVLEALHGQLFKRTQATLWPEFPTRLTAAAFVGASVVAVLVAVQDAGAAEVWLAVGSLSVLYLAAVLWMRRAPALDDLALLPPILLLAVVIWQSSVWGSLYGIFELGFERAPETAPPSTVTVFALLAVVGSALAFWRSLGGERHAQIWAVGAALFAPLMLVLLEIWWAPPDILGAGRWAAHAIIIAAMMVVFAGQMARRDGDDKRRVAYFALAALTMISFALVIILTAAALTLALGVMVLGAAVIDRRLNLPLLGVFVQVGVVVIGWRLVVDPGIFWANHEPLWEVLLAYLGSAALLGAGWLVLAERARARTRLTVESGIWVVLGVLANVLLNREMGLQFKSHWGLSLQGSIWLMLMLVQIYRMRAGGVMRWLRVVLATVYGLVAALFYLLVVVTANPLVSARDAVVGPPVFDSLLAALGIPALVLAIGIWKLPELRRWLRLGFMVLSAGFAGLYVALEIRRLWRGADLSVPGTSDAELYSYTLALLLVSVAVLFFAFSRRSLPLRQIATVGIGLTIAKVFLIDMAGLAGLLRVATFLGLGLSLAGLGWVYRHMAAQWEQGDAAN